MMFFKNNLTGFFSSKYLYNNDFSCKKKKIFYNSFILAYKLQNEEKKYLEKTRQLNKAKKEMCMRTERTKLEDMQQECEREKWNGDWI